MEEEVHGRPLEYWKTNAEEDYRQVPISVLKYITILEEEIEKDRWVSVKDRLPKELEYVLCLLVGWDDVLFQKVLCYDYDSGLWTDYTGEFDMNIISWMPLPNPPKN